MKKTDNYTDMYSRSDSKRLSVIIPTYNCSKYLDECLGSVLDQLPSDCELIAVDDGSTDKTASSLLALSDDHKNLNVILCEHKGASAARNTGLDAACGRYVTFIDCDDRMQPDFLKKSLDDISQDADLYIYGIERVLLTGEKEVWTVSDHVYHDAGTFADEYIRVRSSLIYSNCNKFYRRDKISRSNLRFDESVVFGEDRLFNYQFLMGCTKIVTSSEIMLSYIQRGNESMSTKYLPGYFDQAIKLHRAKIHCFLSLSEGTNKDERNRFASLDLAREIECTLNRFQIHPEEEAENMPVINDLIFHKLPLLADILHQNGIHDPSSWYRTKAGQQLVLDHIRNSL